ncbi:MAG: hypothetical protein EZS28_018644 [Streblomastix strix]|uniref:Uncharacterized protein n=1 Tax=Streblomastix strix TaxID=222440 RepID=A0A5J4VTR7_9EUKA|nr:MAG: hypothetical protein EZS28_018644 [Streblomastix strix]
MSGPVAYTYQNPSFEDLAVDGDLFTHNSNNSHHTVVLFDPLIKAGLTKFEVTNIDHLYGVGIADESVKYQQDQSPIANGNSKVVQYWSGGGLEHISKELTEGNEDYSKEGSRVALELNMDSNPRTLTFFYNDVEQPNYIINIPPAVRFWAHLWSRGTSFKVNKFERLSEPTAKHLEGKSQPLVWGKDWKKKCVIQ